MSFDQNYNYQGIFTRPQDSAPGEYGIVTTHGTSTEFDYTAFRYNSAGTFNQNIAGGWSAYGTVTFAPVPEPSSAMLLAIPGLFLLIRRRRKVRSQAA